MTEIETAIMIKNMAREIVRRKSVKNAMRGAEVTAKTDDGQTVMWRTSINGTDEAIKEYFRPGKRINIGDGPRDRMATIKSVKVLNAAAKNANKTTVKDLLGTPVTVDLDNIYVEHHKSGDTFWESRSNGKRVVLSPEQKRVVMDRVKVKGYDWYEPGTEK